MKSIKNRLSCQAQRIVISSTEYGWKQATGGAPHGLTLRPILFSISVAMWVMVWILQMIQNWEECLTDQASWNLMKLIKGNAGSST